MLKRYAGNRFMGWSNEYKPYKYSPIVIEADFCVYLVKLFNFNTISCHI